MRSALSQFISDICESIKWHICLLPNFNVQNIYALCLYHELSVTFVEIANNTLYGSNVSYAKNHYDIKIMFHEDI